MCHVINHSLEQHFPVSTGVKIIAEPGTYFACSPFTLVTNVIAVKEITKKQMQGVENPPVRFTEDDPDNVSWDGWCYQCVVWAPSQVASLCYTGLHVLHRWRGVRVFLGNALYSRCQIQTVDNKQIIRSQLPIKHLGPQLLWKWLCKSGQSAAKGEFLQWVVSSWSCAVDGHYGYMRRMPC